MVRSRIAILDFFDSEIEQSKTKKETRRKKFFIFSFLSLFLLNPGCWHHQTLHLEEKDMRPTALVYLSIVVVCLLSQVTANFASMGKKKI